MSSGRDGMGGHDPYGQYGLGGQHYGEHKHPEGDYRGRSGGYGRGYGGEMYSGYGAQDQGWGRGDQGHGLHADRQGSQGFDPEYARWRSEQISKLDEDYRAWCQERQSKFNDEFDTWRKGRSSPASGGAVQSNRDQSISGSAIAGGGSSQAGGLNERQTEDEQMKNK